MPTKEMKIGPLWILIFSGLCIAVLSALEAHVQWIAALCGLFGQGCTEAQRFTLFKIPVSYWGIAYYVLLGLVLYFARHWTFWIIVSGFGVELSFLWIMFSMKFICVFCVLNAVVMISLLSLSFSRVLIWQTLAMSFLFFLFSNHLFFMENLHGNAANFHEQPSTVVARVDEKIITAEQLERPLATRIYELENKIHELKQQHLNEMIDVMLLEEEARQRKMTLQELIDSIISEEIPVSDKEIVAYYKVNQQLFMNWKGSKEELKNEIIKQLKREKSLKMIKSYARSLRDQHEVELFLKAPPLPFTKVSVKNSPALGPEDAPVTVVEFSDYLCPACRKAHEITKQIKEMYEGRIKWIFKDFPLDRHKGARELAAVAHCAGEQGKFWEYQDFLFLSKGVLGLEQLNGYAKQLGMEVDRFSQCVASGKYLGKVEEDIKDGKEAGVGATPTFIINGKLNPGVLSANNFKEIIDRELEKEKFPLFSPR